MRKLRLLSILIAIAMLFAANAHAEKYDLGSGVAVKVDYFHFRDSIFSELNVQDGVYVGVEAYRRFLYPNLYVGVEAGYAGTSGSLNGIVPTDNNFGIRPGPYTLNTDINYIPVEFNAKYIYPISRCWNFGIGSGFSVNYIHVRAKMSGMDSINYEGALGRAVIWRVEL